MIRWVTRQVHGALLACAEVGGDTSFNKVTKLTLHLLDNLGLGHVLVKHALHTIGRLCSSPARQPVMRFNQCILHSFMVEREAEGAHTLESLVNASDHLMQSS